MSSIKPGRLCERASALDLQMIIFFFQNETILMVSISFFHLDPLRLTRRHAGESGETRLNLPLTEEINILAACRQINYYILFEDLCRI